MPPVRVLAALTVVVSYSAGCKPTMPEGSDAHAATAARALEPGRTPAEPRVAAAPETKQGSAAAKPTPAVTPPPGAPAGQSAQPGAGPASPLTEKNLETFVGFSADETAFAYTVFSDGAGAYILKVFGVAKGELRENLALESEGELQKARALLEKGGFRALPRDEKTAWTARVDPKGQLTVKDGEKAVAKGPAFADPMPPGTKMSARVHGQSPSGKYVAVEIALNAQNEFGKTRSFSVLPLQPGAGKAGG